MSTTFFRIFSHLLLVALMSAVCCGESAATTTATLAPFQKSRLESDKPFDGKGAGIFQGQREEQSAYWTFDVSRDPNFEDLLGSESLKSAMLTLNLHQDELEITAPELAESHARSGDDNEKNRQLSIHTTAKIEIDLLNIYSAEDLLKLFSEQAGKLPISYHDPEKISSVELQLITEEPKGSPGVMLLTFSALLLVSALLGYVVRQKMSSKHAAPAEQGHHTRLAAVGEQTSTVIHDVKNSFTAIRGCAEIIADDSLSPEERKEFVELIVGEIDRGVYMTQELLEFSRGRKPELQLQTVFTHELLEQTLSVLRKDLQARNVRLHTKIQQTDALQLDPEKMRRVFMNLISNAKEAMPEGGSLMIRSSQKNGRVLVEFIDDGCGMPPELVDRIFEPFMTRGKASGTGLGMAIVKDIIDAHHATIEVESVENQGTSFRIFLPIKLLS